MSRSGGVESSVKENARFKQCQQQLRMGATCHMNKTSHTLTVIAIMIEMSGRGAGSRYSKCGGRDKNTMSLSSQNSLERAGSSTRWDGGKHGAG